MDRLPDAHVSATAAEIAVHGFVDVAVGGTRMFCKQSGSRHNLSSLAVSALRNIDLAPRQLQRMGAVRGQALNGGNFLVGGGGNWCEARPHGLAAQVNRAGPALADSTAVLGSMQV